jgi:hypothetical protein
VSGYPGGTLFNEYRYANGAEVALLDIVEANVISAQPEAHQPENWLLAPGAWQLLERLPPDTAIRHLTPFVVPGPVLLENESDSVAHAALVQQPASASLALVEPRRIQWHITTNTHGQRQTRCYFSLAGSSYDLAITDPVFVERLAGLTYGYHPREAAGIAVEDRVLLTVSLGEPFEVTGHCYKLIAAVLVLPRA